MNPRQQPKFKLNPEPRSSNAPCAYARSAGAWTTCRDSVGHTPPPTTLGGLRRNSIRGLRLRSQFRLSSATCFIPFSIRSFHSPSRCLLPDAMTSADLRMQLPLWRRTRRSRPPVTAHPHAMLSRWPSRGNCSPSFAG